MTTCCRLLGRRKDGEVEAVLCSHIPTPRGRGDVPPTARHGAFLSRAASDEVCSEKAALPRGLQPRLAQEEDGDLHPGKLGAACHPLPPQQPAPFLLLTCLHPAPAYKTRPYPAPAGQAAFQEQSRQVLVSSQVPVPALTSQAARTLQPATPPSEKRLMETVNIDGYHQMSLLYKVIQVAFPGEHAVDSKRPEVPLACPRGLSLPSAAL